MAEVRQIDDKEVFELSILYYEYQQLLPTRHNRVVSLSLLLNELKAVGAIALGLYDNDKLIGFVLGSKHNEIVFHYSAIYILPKRRYYAKKLLTSVEAFIKAKGFKAWTSVGITREGTNVLSKMGAIPVEIKYFKEL